MAFDSPDPISVKMTPRAAWSRYQPATSVSLIAARIASTERARIAPSSFWAPGALLTTIRMNRFFERSARLRSKLSARRNIGSGRSSCPSIGEFFLDSCENRAFTAGRPMVFVTMGKIDATLRKCSELLECLELQGIAARAITRDGLGLVGRNPHDAGLYLPVAEFCTGQSRSLQSLMTRPLVGVPSGTLFRVSTISRPSRATAE